MIYRYCFDENKIEFITANDYCQPVVLTENGTFPSQFFFAAGS